MTAPDNKTIKTPFYDFHVAAGAKMVPFAGFVMPIQYEGMTAEHLAVRENVGLFDLSHMGEFFVSGSGAVEFLQKTMTNNIDRVAVGQIQYTCMAYPEGGIVDDLLVYRLAETEFMLVVNAANLSKDFDWLDSHRSGEVNLSDRTPDYGLLAIQGPRAEAVMAKLTDCDLDSLPYYGHVTAGVAGVELLFSRTGYTGEDGFELYIPNDHCQTVWEAVIEAGAEHDMRLIGLGARDTLRLEMKMTLYGNDIDDTTTPIEAGLSWIVDLEKEFIGRDVMAEQKSNKPKRRLVCLEFEGRVIPRPGYEIYDGDQKIGQVTSGSFSPSLKRPIALGYVARAKAKAGSVVEVLVRDKRFAATVVKPPFYKHASHR